MNPSMSIVLPGAEPFFHQGGSVGCLCLHGFMASPAEMRWLGAHLAEQGLTVYGPRLPGHGTSHRDMARQRWRDWLAAAQDGCALLRAQCERICLVGHSMGGLLALLMAASQPVEAVVALAVPLRFPRRLRMGAAGLRLIRSYTNQRDRTHLPAIVRQEQSRRNEPVIGRVRYDIWSTRAVTELLSLAQVTDSALHQVTAPLLLVYSSADPTVGLQNAERIASGVGSAVVERVIVRRSGHILPQDRDREEVFAAVARFVQRQTQPDSPPNV